MNPVNRLYEATHDRPGGSPRRWNGPAINLLITVSCLIVVLTAMVKVGPTADDPAAEASTAAPASESLNRIAVTTIWVPRPLYDLLRTRSDPSAAWSAADVRDLAEKCRPKAAWYALNYREYPTHGEPVDVSMVRRLSELGGIINEFEDVVLAVTGQSHRCKIINLWDADILVVRDSFLHDGPAQAIARLKPSRVPVGPNSEP